MAQRFPWVHGRVPNGYWNDRRHRVAYLRWLGRRLGFRKPPDWYRLTRQHLLENCGGGLLAVAYRHSPLAAVHDLYPRRDWKPWLMHKTPQRFWTDPAHRHAYMRWLGRRRGFRSINDWYKLRKADVLATGGSGLLANYFGNSIIALLRDYKPDRDWQEWRFVEVPQRFWSDPDGRRRYMIWLGRQLRYRQPEDWYRVTRRDFLRHHGGALLNHPEIRSPLGALRATMPEQDWLAWKFVRVPNGFWADPEHRKAYVRWLGRELGCTRKADWEQVTREQVRARHGGALLSMVYRNALRAMWRDTLPQWKW
jgi:hypothetical protein